MFCRQNDFQLRTNKKFEYEIYKSRNNLKDKKIGLSLTYHFLIKIRTYNVNEIILIKQDEARMEIAVKTTMKLRF